MIYGIAPADLDRYWPSAVEHLERLGDRISLEHERDLCERGERQLYLAVDKGECIAAMITEVVEDPVVAITAVHGAGGRVDEWEPAFHDHLDRWADHIGAEKLRVIGRRGWLRRLEKTGFKEVATIMEKSYG